MEETQANIRQKEIYQYMFSRALGSHGIEMCNFYFNILQELIYDKNMNHLQEDLGEDYKRAMVNLSRFLQVSNKIKECERILLLTKDNNIKRQYLHLLRIETSKMPMIWFDVMHIYVCLIDRSNLKNEPAMKHVILDRENKISFHMPREGEKNQ